MSLPALRDDRRLAPLREELAALGPAALPAIVEALLALPEVPAWARVLGPWEPVGSHVWERYEHRPNDFRYCRSRVWLDAQGRWSHLASGGPLAYPTRREAMEAAEAETRGEWLLVGAPPPEEELAPAPVPTFETRHGAVVLPSGVRGARHQWAPYQREPAVELCSRCDLLRCSGSLVGLGPRMRHFTSTDALNRALRGAGTGSREAGPCAREAP